jgi:hypothetical protein
MALLVIPKPEVSSNTTTISPPNEEATVRLGLAAARALYSDDGQQCWQLAGGWEKTR